MNEPTLVMGNEERRQAQQRSQEQVGPPAQVPGYQEERFLGKGAFGEVWLAQDRNTGRRVAIKFYTHRSGLDWSLLSREVDRLRFLFSDRHVVQLLEVGWEADPPYYVMEYLERGSLEEILHRQGPMPAAQAVTLIREVAIGLVHAHGKGILHCDLKPANVLLDQDNRPRLADFGQSRLSHEQSHALGTLFYMAPEQADLKAVPDARWDVYALGAVFYHLLTGQPPFRQAKEAGEILKAENLEDRLDRYRRLIHTSPRPSSHRRAPGVNRGLAEIVDRCLAPDPKHRFANVQAVLNALDGWGLKRARRPLLVLGALGPVLLLLVLAFFAWKALGMTVDDTKSALTDKALESNFFAARFVAEHFALDIDKRWRILQLEAADPRLRTALKKIAALPPDPMNQQYRELQIALQGWLDKRFQRHQVQFKPGTEAASWVMNDHRGIQVARHPLDKNTLNKDYSFRDYFHGGGTAADGKGKKPKPIRQPHRSVVFRSRATNTLMVGFSVPVSDPDEKIAEPVGVLAMAVELGNFLELASDNRNQFAVLIDTHSDSENHKAGLILEHPYLDLHRKQHEKTPAYYVADDVLKRALFMQSQRLDELQKHFQRQSGGEVHLQPLYFRHFKEQDFPGDYLDPVENYRQTSWLATLEPVILVREPGEIHDTGWVILVQKRYQEALDPVNTLEGGLLHLGMLALVIVGVVVTGLWGFVILVLDNTGGSRLMGVLRRWKGLPSTGLSETGKTPTPSAEGFEPTMIDKS